MVGYSTVCRWSMRRKHTAWASRDNEGPSARMQIEDTPHQQTTSYLYTPITTCINQATLYPPCLRL